MSSTSCRTRSVTQRNPRFRQPIPKIRARYRPADVAPTKAVLTEASAQVSLHHNASGKQGTNANDARVLSSNANKDRSMSLAKLQVEKMMVDDSVRRLEARIKMTYPSRPNENTMQMLGALRETLQEDVIALRHDVEAYKDPDPQCVTRTREEIEATRSNADKWTNNIDILEGWLCRTLGTDAGQMEQLRRDFHGAEYTEGE